MGKITPNEVALKKLALAVDVAVSDYLIESNVTFAKDLLRDTVIFRVRGYVLAEDEPARHYSIKCPASWWQAFKERFFPYFLKNMFPVRYNTHEINVEAIYPGFKPALPDKQHRLIIREVHNDSATTLY